MLRMGTARRTINPGFDIPHVGWGAQTHIFGSGLESDFWVTVMALSGDQTSAILADVDTSHITVAHSDEIRQAVADATGIPVGSIRISTTHTHSGPMIWAHYYPENEQAIHRYVRMMLEQTVAAALEACANMEPVKAAGAYGDCRIGRNRRQTLEGGRTVVGFDNNGTADPVVGLVRFEDETGAIKASITHYSCHPTILGYSNQLYSPEYPGVVKRMVEQHAGGVSLFLQGATGNIGPGPEGFTDDVTVMKRLGTILGCEAVKTLLETRETGFRYSFGQVVESGAPLGVWSGEYARGDSGLETASRMVPLPLQQQLPPELAREIAHGYQRELEALRKNHASDEAIKDTTYKAKRAFFALDRSNLYYGKTTMEVEIHAICIGDIALIGVPFEPFVEIGMSVREQSPFAHTMFSGYSNGWFGYLPNCKDYPAGGYEVDTTPFAENAAEILISAVTQLLKELHDKMGEVILHQKQSLA